VAVQIVSLASILVAPIWLQWSGSKPTVVRRVSGAEAYPVISPKDLRPETITSRTLLLATPDAPPPESVRVSTAQLRFEWVSPEGAVASKPAALGGLRAPASKKGWTLSKIERREGEQWAELPLLLGESRQPLGSSYFELHHGVNEFRVSFRSASGAQKSYPLHVRH
jgi:hypothetical protein